MEHADALERGLSSSDVLFQWLAVAGNVAKWVEPADGKRAAVSNNEMMLAHHITHRTPKGIEEKLYFIRQKFDQADAWLERKGIRYCDANSEVKHKLEKICPDYPKLTVLLHPLRVQRSTRNQVYSSDGKASGRRTKRNAEGRAEDNVKGPEVDLERVSPRVRSSRPNEPGMAKRPRFESLRTAPLEARSNVRRELFRLEIQIKRDQAICVRAKSRKELLSLGVSMEEVDRLMPLGGFPVAFVIELTGPSVSGILRSGTSTFMRRPAI
jgi:hypothetical protein